MFPCRRVNSLALSLTAIICAVMAFGVSDVQASCGNYLHTRFGPPPQRVFQPRDTLLATAGLSEAGWNRFASDPQPFPCSGPNCGRSSAPPMAPPAIPVRVASGPQEAAATLFNVFSLGNAAGWLWLPAATVSLQTVPQPIDVPPEC